MIKNFKCRETEKIFNRQYSRKLPQLIQRIAIACMVAHHRSLNSLKTREQQLSATYQEVYELENNHKTLDEQQRLLREINLEIENLELQLKLQNTQAVNSENALTSESGLTSDKKVSELTYDRFFSPAIIASETPISEPDMKFPAVPFPHQLDSTSTLQPQ